LVLRFFSSSVLLLAVSFATEEPMNLFNQNDHNKLL
jgi:hypothetical protein